MNRSDEIVKSIEDKLLAMSPSEREKYLKSMGFEYEKSTPSYPHARYAAPACASQHFPGKVRRIAYDG